MPGLLLIVTQMADERHAAAVELAACAAALGRPVAVLVKAEATKELARPVLRPDYQTLVDLGASIAACQTAMAAHDLAADDLAPGVEALGILAFLEGRADWQVVIA